MVIIHHPKMVAMWARRVIQIRSQYGKTTAEKWAKMVFGEENIPVINKELERSLGSENK